MLRYNARNNIRGFTLIEALTVLVIVGILSAVSAPSFLGMLNRNKMSDALSKVRGALQEAQRVSMSQSKKCSVGLSSGAQPKLTSNCFMTVDYIIKASAAAAGATTVSVAPLPVEISNGTTLVFSNGANGVVSADTAKGSNSLSLSSGLSAAISNSETVAVRNLPNEVRLASTTNGRPITFTFRGNTNSGGTIVLYMSDNSIQTKKCFHVSTGIGIMRYGNYTGSISPINREECRTQE